MKFTDLKARTIYHVSDSFALALVLDTSSMFEISGTSITPAATNRYRPATLSTIGVGVLVLEGVESELRRIAAHSNFEAFVAELPNAHGPLGAAAVLKRHFGELGDDVRVRVTNPRSMSEYHTRAELEAIADRQHRRERAEQRMVDMGLTGGVLDVPETDRVSLSVGDFLDLVSLADDDRIDPLLVLADGR